MGTVIALGEEPVNVWNMQACPQSCSDMKVCNMSGQGQTGGGSRGDRAAQIAASQEVILKAQAGPSERPSSGARFSDFKPLPAHWADKSCPFLPLQP